jgi:hypothetical protein
VRASLRDVAVVRITFTPRCAAALAARAHRVRVVRRDDDRVRSPAATGGVDERDLLRGGGLGRAVVGDRVAELLRALLGTLAVLVNTFTRRSASGWHEESCASLLLTCLGPSCRPAARRRARTAAATRPRTDEQPLSMASLPSFPGVENVDARSSVGRHPPSLSAAARGAGKPCASMPRMTLPATIAASSSPR